MKQVEIYILSGFLGAGKTTLLQQALAEEQRNGRKAAVVMNEIGQVSIDSDAVPNGTPLKELLNGCVCCTLSDKLEVQLSELLNQYDLDVIYIETTGAAHPVEVLDSCLSPQLADKVRIHSIITLIDAPAWLERQKLKIPLRKLVTEQAKHADIMILNKIDRITEKQLQEIEDELHLLNPKGLMIPTSFADIDFHKIQNAERIKRTEHEQTHAFNHLHMKTYVHSFSQPIDGQLFANFLRALPDNIYRIKGYVRFNGDPKTYLFQYAYGMPIHTASGLKMKTILVFIGDELDHEGLQKALSELEKNSREMPL